jgi:decaprenylphospho-beta-D-erythro-pentofuranosid-2-ulose 2-reductase
VQNAVGDVQSVLVLGGASDIGLATARRLVESGASTVVLAARDPGSLQEACRDLRARGATTVEAVPFDACATDDHASLVDTWFQRFGDIDVALLAFGVLGDQATFDGDPAAAVAAVTANYTGAVSTGLALARAMRTQGHGAIVVLSSVAGERARKTNFVYGSSKAGLDAFAQGLGDSLVGSGVRVVVVRPGFVHSKMTTGMDAAPLSTTPEAVAESIAGALASGREIVWVPSPLRLLMAAFRHLPRPLWRKVSAAR